MNQIFNDLDHRLSVVKRWAILHTIQTQSVAEHVFNVERIAIRIATDWFGIEDVDSKWAIVKWAHHHDDNEALSGDLPTMVKPYFEEEAFQLEHSDILPRKWPANEPVKLIVKLADMMEGYHFLAVETVLGNYYCRDHFEAESRRIVDWALEHFDGGIAERVRQWMSELDPKSVRHSRRGR